MRYDAEHKRRTRARVLAEAAKAVRVYGPHRLAVAGVMAEAGLTHGGFYAHFASKDEFLVATVEQARREAEARANALTVGLAPAEALGAYLDFYLSAEHRDERSSGCPLPFLAADAPRLPEPVRARIAEGAARMAERLADLLRATGCENPEALAVSAVAELVGALTLARAEPDLARANVLLARSRAALGRRLGLEPAA